MNDNDTKRLSRLTAILTQLQTKRLTTATSLAKKFNVTVRTIYRDIRALEDSGVPIVTEEGKGYSLLEGYRLPPVSFTESEANALITAEKFVLKNKDGSFVREYVLAIEKIKAVLRSNTKDSAELLSKRMAVAMNDIGDKTSNHLATLQMAITNFSLATIEYQKADTQDSSTRIVEPFALLSTQDNWLLVAFCRVRKDFRSFRLDRIKRLTIMNDQFEPHKITLQEYFERPRPLT